MKIIKNKKSSSSKKQGEKIILNQREQVLYNFFQQNLSDLKDKIESTLQKDEDGLKNEKS